MLYAVLSKILGHPRDLPWWMAGWSIHDLPLGILYMMWSEMTIRYQFHFRADYFQSTPGPPSKFFWSFEGMRFECKVLQMLWNLTGGSAAVLPSHLPTFKVIRLFSQSTHRCQTAKIFQKFICSKMDCSRCNYGSYVPFMGYIWWPGHSFWTALCTPGYPPPRILHGMQNVQRRYTDWPSDPKNFTKNKIGGSFSFFLQL